MKSSTVAYLLWILFLVLTFGMVTIMARDPVPGVIIVNIWLAAFLILRELERRLPW